MYDHLTGEITDKSLARLVVRAGGIGFDLEVPTATAAAVTVGALAQLYTILQVVDGNPVLLGFAKRTERDLARLLLSVSGVGKAITLAMLSTFTPAEIAGAILRGDHAMLKRVKGVGVKTAERVCLELRDQVAKLDLGDDRARAAALPVHAEDAIAALMTLGYSAREARERVQRHLAAEPAASVEDLVKAVLRSG